MMTTMRNSALKSSPGGVDARVSLCRLGIAEVLAAGAAADDHVEVRLVDKPDLDLNPHRDFVFAGTADTAQAIDDAMAIPDVCVDEDLARIETVLHMACPSPKFRRTLQRLHANGVVRRASA
jgi:hypothetical protein